MTTEIARLTLASLPAWVPPVTAAAVGLIVGATLTIALTGDH